MDNKKMIKATLYFALGTIFMGIGLFCTMLLSPIFLFALVPSLACIGRILPALGQYIKNSIFQVHQDYIIHQNGLAHPLRTILCMVSENKKKKFQEELTNLIVELDVRDEEENRITYETDSHPYTKHYLEELERNEYIRHFFYESSKQNNLIIEKIEFGNLKRLSQKEEMYKMSFMLTDKERKKEKLLELWKNAEIEREKEIRKKLIKR